MSEPYTIRSELVTVNRLKRLGFGTFGTVYRGTLCGSPVAVKILNAQTLTDEELDDFTHEAKTNHAIRPHTNILAFFGIIKEPGHYALIMELMPKGSLYSLIKNLIKSADEKSLAWDERKSFYEKSLPWDERKRIARDIACGMYYLHEANVFHRDLKSPNVLLAMDGTAKVGDFGLSRVHSNSTAREFTHAGGGTALWAAPEILRSFNPFDIFEPKYTRECDVYSYAITLTELFTLTGPYGLDINKIQLKPLLKKVSAGEREQLPDSIPPLLRDLVKDCWAHDPKQRPPFSLIVARLDSSDSGPVYESARDELCFTPPPYPPQSSHNNDQNTIHHTPVTASGRGRSAYSTPSSLSPVSQASSGQPIDGGSSDSAASDVASLTRRLDNLGLQLNDLFNKTETLEDKIDNATNVDDAERLKNRLKNYQARQEDLRVERKRVQARIDRLLSHAAQPLTPTATPPKSTSTSSFGSAASTVNPTDCLSPATQLPTPAAAPPTSASTSSSESAALIVNPTDLEKLYERGRALDPAFGDEKSRNHSAAFELYHKAAIAGHPASQNAVGYQLDQGLGVEKNAAKAVEWYRKAADQGNPKGQYNLGLCYRHGGGVGKDLKMAVHWYEKAAKQGYAEAQANLGCCYQDGLGVGKDKTKAVELYKMAAKQGVAFSQYNIGLCYANGFGVAKDETRAVEWYKKAAEQGHAKAHSRLGECYEKGVGLEKDERKAVEWYKLAAEAGNVDGQYNLGMCYFDGIGVAEDRTRGVELLRKAEAQGNLDAYWFLKAPGAWRLVSKTAAWMGIC
ncbi:hypothetical protein HK104_000666 [Borealophlyctis nickersoniae]|nr:hypothetical protein HK104_000666 [Borealophlyctis nickersoniae]